MAFSLTLIAGLFFMGWIYPQTPVFINEIHYDNAGADLNEGVEVAGPAGTGLGGWKLIFYNGNGGVAYDSVDLSGTIPDQQNGFGTTWTDAPGSIQNGPDGIALINSSGEIIQFLGYEGSFTSTEGPAKGLTSTDIGVEESGGTEPGQSLQLSGEGGVYEDFSWMANITATPNAVNASQAFGTQPPGDTIPPFFTTGYPRAVNITEDRFDVLLNLSEACTVYYLARKGNDLAPDSLDVLCGDTLMVARSGIDYTIHIDTASPSSTYDIYFLAVDNETPPNVMDSAFMLQVNTTGDKNLRLVSPQANDTVYVGDSVSVAWTSAYIDSIRISLFAFLGNGWTDLTGEGIPAADSTWGFHVPADAGLDSMILRIANAQDSSLHLESGVFYLADTITPKIIRLSPPNHSTGVPLLPSMKMEFDERVYPGSGNIRVRGEDGGMVENIDVTGESIKFDTGTYSVHIMLSSSLLFSGKYHILIDPGAIRDYQDNEFGGFSSDTNWIFTTILPTGGTGHSTCWDNPAENRIRIYPNPAEGWITLEWNGNKPTKLDVEIIGMNGRTVFRNSYPSIIELHKRIELQHLVSGIYMLRIRTEEGISVTWLVVQ